MTQTVASKWMPRPPAAPNLQTASYPSMLSHAQKVLQTPGSAHHPDVGQPLAWSQPPIPSHRLFTLHQSATLLAWGQLPAMLQPPIPSHPPVVLQPPVTM